jgi:purine-binding chemotaxis protein CheW
MREDYWKGVSDPEKAPEYLVECVLFLLGGALCAFETSYAVEVIRIPKLTRVPSKGERALVQGAFSLRGDVFLAMDIRPLLDLPLVPLEKNSRIILVKSPSFITGILAEAVIEVADLSYNSFHPLETEAVVGSQDYFRGLLSLNARDIRLLDMDAVLASQDIIVDLAAAEPQIKEI